LLNELGNPPAMRIDAKALEKFRCHWSIKENEGWKPCVRIGATLTHCGTKALLFGGYNKVAQNDISFIDFKKA
jgi:hypothetical protein